MCKKKKKNKKSVKKKNTRKTDRNCISWVVIGTNIICTERSQDPDNCFDQENDLTCYDTTTLSSEDMF